MNTNLFCLLACCLLFTACEIPILDDTVTSISDSWGPTSYQVDAIYENGSTSFYVQIDSSNLLHYSFDPTPSEDLPFEFNEKRFDQHREIIISSPYPIRPNCFRVSNSNCPNSDDSMTGTEFVIVKPLEKKYQLIVRLEESYWNCLQASSAPMNFSFQLLDVFPQTPTRYTLHGFYNLEEELVYLKAQKQEAGHWLPTPDYQVFQEPGPHDITFHIAKHPQLGEFQSLIRINSILSFIPSSVWVGLPGECLQQADWEVHANRINNRYRTDIVTPDCYLDCMKEVADGFEFQLDFFQ